MKTFLLAAIAALCLVVLPPAAAAAPGCGLPETQPLWIDFGDGSVPFWHQFAKPGNVVAASNTVYPPRIREAGAKTVYFDLYLNNRVGTPTKPKDRATIADRANRLFELAVRSSACEQPLIALNELFGASLHAPWTSTNAQYRENVLTFMRTLAARGARPLLLISSAPYTSGAAADWWRQAAEVGDLVPEVYFNAPAIYEEGPILGNRRLRTAMRRAVERFTSIGIPPSKIGIVLGFQTAKGAGGREGLQPREAWFDVVKWQALAATQVARETGIATIWSWGWASWSEQARDPDKEAAACVYLWARDPALCDAPALAGPEFEDSRTDGQLIIPAGEQCTFADHTIRSGELTTLQRVTGDRDVAFTILLTRLAERGAYALPTKRVLAAERAVIALRFDGDAAAYRQALAAAGATVAVARSVLADELRRLGIESRMRARTPSDHEVSTFYLSYPDLPVRLVEADPAPWWLGGQSRGLAVVSLAPNHVFELALGGRSSVRTIEGTYSVRAVGEVAPLGTIPFSQARPALAAVLGTFARRAAADRWSLGRQESALESALCRRDVYPEPGTLRLTGYLPFLALNA
jgi:hypothetical protein